MAMVGFTITDAFIGGDDEELLYQKLVRGTDEMFIVTLLFQLGSGEYEQHKTIWDTTAEDYAEKKVQASMPKMNREDEQQVWVQED